MEKEEQIRQRKNSIAESFASLSIGLWTVSLIGYLTSAISCSTYSLAIGGTISALLSIYLILPWDWKRKRFLTYSKTNEITKIVKAFGWFIVLAVFAVGLIQTGVFWLIVAGIIVGGIAYAIFLFSLFRIRKDKKKKWIRNGNINNKG